MTKLMMKLKFLVLFSHGRSENIERVYNVRSFR